ncbi:MAG: class I SAM-dependent methyltransferase [Anaerolineae bacterium]|jgi:SAM-dependent methyltransferase|nr:class I SAM-dependent methyltransferase [Anaerolineae bacterium]
MTKRRRAIERLVRSGQLLDVGSATGNFLHEMKRSGNWEVEGVEPNLEAATHAEERLGLTVHRGDLCAVSLPTARYDVVTMWNVIEHLHAPMVNLREVARLLKDNGVFVFSIPNLRSWEARRFGPYWMGWELPRHLYYPSQEAMAAMLDEVGLEMLHWDCLLGAYPSFLLTLRFRLQALAPDAWWVRAILALCGSAPMQVAAIPVFGLLTRVRKASLITGFARRRNR